MKRANQQNIPAFCHPVEHINTSSFDICEENIALLNLPLSWGRSGETTLTRLPSNSARRSNQKARLIVSTGRRTLGHPQSLSASLSFSPSHTFVVYSLSLALFSSVSTTSLSFPLLLCIQIFTTTHCYKDRERRNQANTCKIRKSGKLDFPSISLFLACPIFALYTPYRTKIKHWVANNLDVPFNITTFL